MGEGPATPTLLILGDSLAYYGPHGPLPADDERIWPNVAAAELGGRSELFAGIGWTSRDAWWSLTGDPRVWPVLRTVDVLVLQVGGMDTLPAPLPGYLRGGIRYLYPDRLRRLARSAYLAAQPRLSRWTGRVALPPRRSVHYLDRCVAGVRALLPGLPVVAMVPSVHRAASYGYAHGGHAPACAAIRAWASARDVALLDLPELVGAHVRSGRGNADGIHWGFDAHHAVGTALAALIARCCQQRA